MKSGTALALLLGALLLLLVLAAALFAIAASRAG